MIHETHPNLSALQVAYRAHYPQLKCVADMLAKALHDLLT